MLVIILMLLATVCALAAWQLTRLVRVWVQMSGDRLVTCTATGYPAVVRTSGLRGSVTSFIFRNPKTRITECSLWAAGGPCDQGCVTEAFAPESTVQSIAGRWYENKKCVYCAKPITLRSFGHRAARLGPQGTTREWSDVPADHLLESLRTASPVCWNCHVAETL